MSVEVEPKPRPSLFEEVREESLKFWRHMPDKGLFFGLLAAWLVFFHFLGNSVFGYIDTVSLLRWMYHIYDTSPDDGHGLLMPFVVIGLLYWKRETLMALRKEVWWPALGIVGLALCIHFFGYAVQFPQVSIVGFYLGIYGLTGLVWGAEWLRASFFPMLLFAFAVPLGTLGDKITVPMRLFATMVTSGVCNTVLGIEVVRQGNQLFEPSGRFQYEVAAACGGIRSLIALLGLSTVYAFISFQSNVRRGLIISAAFPLAIAGNVFRLVCIIVASEAFGVKAGAFVHDHLGLLPYIPAIIGLIALGAFLREKPPTSPLHMEVKPA